MAKEEYLDQANKGEQMQMNDSFREATPFERIQANRLLH